MRDKYTELKKEYRKVINQYDSFELGSYRGKTNRPITWVPVDENDVVEWELSYRLSDNKLQHKDLIIKLLEVFCEPVCTKKVSVVKIIRANSFKYRMCKQEVFKKLSYYYRLPRSIRFSYYTPPEYTFFSLGSEISQYQYDRFMSNLNLEERNLAKLFFNSFKKTHGHLHQEYTYYSLKQGYGETIYQIPIHYLTIKITQVRVKEIGLLDPEWEKAREEIWWNRWDNYKFVPQWSESRNKWCKSHAKKVRSHVKRLLNQVTKLDLDQYEDRESLFRVSKLDKNDNRHYNKWII